MIAGISSGIFFLPIEDPVFPKNRHSLPVSVMDVSPVCICDNSLIRIVFINVILIFRIIHCRLRLCNSLRDQSVSCLPCSRTLIFHIGIGIKMTDISKRTFVQITAFSYDTAFRRKPVNFRITRGLDIHRRIAGGQFPRVIRGKTSKGNGSPSRIDYFDMAQCIRVQDPSCISPRKPCQKCSRIVCGQTDKWRICRRIGHRPCILSCQSAGVDITVGVSNDGSVGIRKIVASRRTVCDRAVIFASQNAEIQFVVFVDILFRTCIIMYRGIAGGIIMILYDLRRIIRI